MTCSEVEARLVDAGDGHLDLPTEMRLHAHLDGCAACRDRAAFWRALVPGIRALAPTPPDAMQSRRVQLELERRLGAAREPAPRARWRRRAAPAAIALAAAAAALLVIAPRIRRGGHGPGAPAPAFAIVVRAAGAVTVGGRPVTGDARLDAGAELALSAASDAELAIGRASSLRISGPARLTLGGEAHAVTLRLQSGTLEAAVSHREEGETFAVVTPDARVDVRGTRFSVRAAPEGSWVRVREGRVEVRFSDGRTALVAAGEVASSSAGVPPAVTPAERAVPDPADTAVARSTSEPAPPDTPPPGAAAPTPVCAEVRRACRSAARSARGSMRAGAYGRALRLVTEAAAARDGRDRGGDADRSTACDDSVAGCADELGYLRAEALRLSGRLDAAVAAYKALDRRGAPAPMRQNALYAAAQLEQRQGRDDRARADYERALATAPGGALHGEALLGAMESAAAAGDGGRAAALAQRYLDEFPNGLGAASARRLAPAGPRH